MSKDKSKGGRPLLFKTPEALQEAIDAYFDSGNNKTIIGLADHLRIGRRTLYDYSRRGEYSDVLYKAIKLIKRQNRVLADGGTKKSGYVYIVRCGDFNLYKIGISKLEPHVRLSALQSGCPFPLYMISIYYCDFYSLLEAEIHNRYAKYNKMGEWFELTDQQLLCIQSEIEEQATRQISLF